MRWLCLLCLITTLEGADKWSLAFFHDQKDSALNLSQIVFPSERRGLAIGMLTEKGRQKPMVVLTSDGGKKWEMIPFKDAPLAIACFNDSLCWISTGKAIWVSEEAGRTWQKVSNQKDVVTLYFDSAQHGFAGGMEKSAWETNDGGKTWKLLEFVKGIEAKPEHAAFHTLGFGGRFGLIAGTSRPPRRDDMSLLPPWMEPEQAAKRRDWPNLLMLGQSQDGGKTWLGSSVSAFGMISKILVEPAGFGLGLIEFGDNFEFPSEISRIDFKSGQMSSVYRKKEHAVQDIAYLPNRSLVAAGIEPTPLRSLRLPSKVVIREAPISPNGEVKSYVDHEVDYRASARRVQLAATPGGQLWAVTDSGMILRLDRR